jgi:DNA-binding NarL/FixJ family response regulator
VTVVVADDHGPFRRAAGAVIARTSGFRLVGEAVDGAEALQRVAEVAPDLVLMDIRMPVLDGIAAARRLAERHPEVVVLLLSSYDRGDLPPGLGSDGAAYLHKEELSPSVLSRLWAARAPRAAEAAPELDGGDGP